MLWEAAELEQVIVLIQHKWVFRLKLREPKLIWMQRNWIQLFLRGTQTAKNTKLSKIKKLFFQILIKTKKFPNV